MSASTGVAKADPPAPKTPKTNPTPRPARTYPMNSMTAPPLAPDSGTLYPRGYLTYPMG
jgi:hypothetical protein